MAIKGKKNAGDSANEEALTGKPTFPYTNKPGSLRKFLQGIPKRPRPPKINQQYLRAHGFKDANDHSIIRVLKSVGMLNDANEPTPLYTEFMKPNIGPVALGSAVKGVYSKIFEHSHQPHNEQEDTLKNYFHIHSGGGASTVNYQIQTFKALCDSADFRESASVAKAPDGKPSVGELNVAGVSDSRSTGAGIHIDLHIHLPENKTRRDYEYMFEDIARYLFGRDVPVGDRHDPK